VVYASICKRVIAFFVLFCSCSNLYSMVADNPYFPLFPRLYTGAHKNEFSISTDMVFMAGGEAFSAVPSANPADRIIGYPALFGKRVDKEGHLDLNEVDAAFQQLNNTGTLFTGGSFIPGRSADINIAAHLQAQMVSCAGNIPVAPNFSFGWSAFFMRTIGEARISLNIDAADRLNLTEISTTTGARVIKTSGQMEFAENLSKIQKALDMNDNVSREFGSGDVLLYGSWYLSEPYTWKCRVVDFSLAVGLMMPIGVQSNIDNIASVPYGGQGHWGFFAMPHLELELRDDLKVGMMVRLSKRLKKTRKIRVPILNESPLFAPYKADVEINPGITFGISPYIVFEHVRSGFGMELRYTVAYHESDEYYDNRINKQRDMKLINLIPYSTWKQEYGTVKILYDMCYEKDVRFRPVFNVTWDIPLNYMTGENFGKTHAISLGCNFNF
jgi:hypothetical protein